MEQHRETSEREERSMEQHLDIIHLRYTTPIRFRIDEVVLVHRQVQSVHKVQLVQDNLHAAPVVFEHLV